jgi:hypothetical protein
LALLVGLADEGHRGSESETRTFLRAFRYVKGTPPARSPLEPPPPELSVDLLAALRSVPDLGAQLTRLHVMGTRGVITFETYKRLRQALCTRTGA